MAADPGGLRKARGWKKKSRSSTGDKTLPSAGDGSNVNWKKKDGGGKVVEIRRRRFTRGKNEGRRF